MWLFVTALAFLIVALVQVRIDAVAHPNIIWQILAFFVLTAGEILVSVTHLEFAYTQAPKKLKSLVMCTYLLGISLGNLFTAIVDFFTRALHLQGETQGSLSARYFFFFVIVMLITAILFLFFAR